MLWASSSAAMGEALVVSDHESQPCCENGFPAIEASRPTLRERNEHRISILCLKAEIEFGDVRVEMGGMRFCHMMMESWWGLT